MLPRASHLYKVPRSMPFNISCIINYSCSGFSLLCVQVSRTIGDAYLKSSEFNCESLLACFRILRAFHKPILCPEPSIEEHRLCAKYQFVIFASDGLWEHLSNQEAVDIVHCSPRNVRWFAILPHILLFPSVLKYASHFSLALYCWYVTQIG